MTVTRTLTNINSVTQTNINESTVDSADPGNTQSSNFVQGSSYKYDGTSGPAATKAFHRLLTLSSGALTIDLTALVDTDLTIDMTGLHLRELYAISATANANSITLKPGASNGYTGWVGTNGIILATANDQNKLGPLYGQIAVDGTHKTIDISGTGAQQVYLSLLFG